MSAFSDGNDAIYADDNIAEGAFWRVGGQEGGIPCRIIRSTPDDSVTYRGVQMVVETVFLEVRKSEIETPLKDDKVDCARDGSTFAISAKPMLDDLGLNWKCQAVRVTQ